jgi:parallel beta-helix repeat protein
MRQIHFLSSVLFLFVSISWLTTAQAAIIYVDKDNPCPGIGSSANPYCSLQNAFNNVAAGDTIRVRDSAIHYSESAVLTTSGTHSKPIIIEADSGHNPTLKNSLANAQAGVVHLANVDHVTVRNLTFDGIGVQTSRYAIAVYANSKDVVGITISGNTIKNWGGTGENTLASSAIVFRPAFSGGAYLKWNVTGTISNNTITNSAHGGIRLTHTKNAIVENNIITGMRCGRKSDGNRGADGIKDTNNSIGSQIRNNRISDHVDSANCPLSDGPTGDTYTGIYCDVGPTNGVIEGNEVYNIDAQTNGTGSGGVGSEGIFVESKCHDWIVRRNVVHHIGTYGIRNGSPSTGDANRTIIVNNTISYIRDRAIWVRRGNNLTIKNNIFHHNNATAGIEVHSTAVGQGPHTIAYNFYWDMNEGTKVGRWGDFTTRNLTTWRQSCNCDAGARSGDPLFISVANGHEDFRLSPSSPARGAGEGGVDIGAYQSVGFPAAPGLLRVEP